MNPMLASVWTGRVHSRAGTSRPMLRKRADHIFLSQLEDFEGCLSLDPSAMKLGAMPSAGRAAK